MYINEMFGANPDQLPAPDEEANYRNEEDDNTVIKMGDLRKSRLTFAHLKKLRNMHDARNYEKKTNIKDLKTQFAAPPEESEPAF